MVRSISLSEHPLRMFARLSFLLITLAVIVFGSEAALGCTGCIYSLRVDVGAMTCFDRLGELFTTWCDDSEVLKRDELVFLYPFTREKPNEMAPLWQLVYRRKPASFPPPTTDLFESAIRSSDWNTAGSEARKIVDQVLDMPAEIAGKYQPELIQALEFIEVQPLFKKIDTELIKNALWDGLPSVEHREVPPEILDVLEMRSLDRKDAYKIIKAKPHHPRIATLRFVALRNEFARKVPDGWTFDIRRSVSGETWCELQESVDLWLMDYPQHPLADLALLWKTRICYFKGDTEGAWRALLSVYPRRLLRVLYEMRYLLINAPRPEVYLRTIDNPLLFTALLPSMSIDSEQWARWWRVSEENISRPWAANLQERLLAKCADPSSAFPPSFPREPRNPTQLWGKLRAVALMNAGKWEDARNQIFSLAPDEEQALLAAAFHLRSGKPLLAAQVIRLPELIRFYLVRVILSDEELLDLKTKKNMVLRKEAIFEEGVRLTEKGEWAEAAETIRTVDPARSERWRVVALLRSDTSATGPLRLARFFKANRAKLFYDNDSLWHATLGSRYWVAGCGRVNAAKCKETAWLPWTRDLEFKAITLRFAGTTEMWLALQAYVEWLSTAEPSPQMWQVIKEADYCYNRLIGPGYWNSGFWSDFLPDHPVVKKLREAGKRAKRA